MLPIVLHHGIFGYDRMQFGPLSIAYFGGGIEREIRARGNPLIVARVSRTGSIATRAEQLKQAILNQPGSAGQRVVILAHSMGGLDARYMISHLDMAGRVSALVTLSTPHRGASYADWALKHIDNTPPLQGLLRVIGLGLEGVRDLTRAAVERFNEKTPNHPDVAYYSVTAARPWHRVPAFLVHAHRLTMKMEGPNDGIVSVASAEWGTHLETWPADHLHMVNRIMVLEIRKRTGNVRKRYAAVLDRLIADGHLSSQS